MYIWLWFFFFFLLLTPIDSPDSASGKESTCQCWRHKRLEFDPWVQKIPLEKAMATHSSVLAWRISWTEEPGRLYSPWGHQVHGDSTFTFTLKRKHSSTNFFINKGTPFICNELSSTISSFQNFELLCHLGFSDLIVCFLPRCLKTPLVNLPVTNCWLTESDLTPLSPCLDICQL